MNIESYFDKIRDSASRIVNHIESTIDMQRTTIFPVHFTGDSHHGESSWSKKEKRFT